jgi:predicted DNA-binding protein
VTVAKLIRFPAELVEWLENLAATERRSFTAQVIRIIEEWKAKRDAGGE